MNEDDAVAAAYDARSAEYIAAIGSIDQMEEADVELIARWRDETPGALLDAGCGPGHWTAFLHDGERDVVGIDLSAAFVTAARARTGASTSESSASAQPLAALTGALPEMDPSEPSALPVRFARS